MVFTVKCLESHEVEISPTVSLKAVVFYQKILWDSKLLSQLMIAHNKIGQESHPVLYFKGIDSEKGSSLVKNMKIRTGLGNN